MQAILAGQGWDFTSGAGSRILNISDQTCKAQAQSAVHPRTDETSLKHVKVATGALNLPRVIERTLGLRAWAVVGLVASIAIPTDLETVSRRPVLPGVPEGTARPETTQDPQSPDPNVLNPPKAHYRSLVKPLTDCRKPDTPSVSPLEDGMQGFYGA